MDREEQLNQKDFIRQLIIYAHVDAIGLIAVFLGAYSKLQEPLFEFLASSDMQNALIIVGIPLFLWAQIKLLKLVKERSQSLSKQ